MEYRYWATCRNLALAFAICCNALPAFAQRDVPLKLLPSSKWNIDYAENKCSLARAFGEGDQKVIVMFEKYQRGDAFALTFSGTPMDAFRKDHVMGITFGPNEAYQRVPFYASATGGPDSVIFIQSRQRIAPIPKAILDAWARAPLKSTLADVPPIKPEQEAAVKHIILSHEKRPAIQIEIGSLRNAMAQMNDCLDSLVASWGFDPAKIAKASRSAKPIVTREPWITPADYPTSAVALNKMGAVNVRLNVGTNGRVEGCHLLQVNDPIDFADFVCKTLSVRGRFEPALDEAGVPMRSFHVTTVSFVLPSD